MAKQYRTQQKGGNKNLGLGAKIAQPDRREAVSVPWLCPCDDDAYLSVTLMSDWEMHERVKRKNFEYDSRHISFFFPHIL